MRGRFWGPRLSCKREMGAFGVRTRENLDEHLVLNTDRSCVLFWGAWLISQGSFVFVVGLVMRLMVGRLISGERSSVKRASGGCLGAERR
jgi:hypothetical protein